jgi:hypothetical protein
MKRYLDQLNQLKPQERRIVVGVILATFVVLNYFFVFPYFGDLGRANTRMMNAERTLERYKTELNRKASVDRQIMELEKSGGTSVPAEDQAIHFVRLYNQLAAENNVLILNNGRPTTHTNAFFLEQEVGIQVQAGEKQLVDFLYSLGSGSSMIRVRGVSLHPDQSHQQLNSALTLVASYQKTKAPAKAATPAPAPAAPKTVAATPAPQPDKPKAAAPATKSVATNKPPAKVLPPGTKSVPTKL